MELLSQNVADPGRFAQLTQFLKDWAWWIAVASVIMFFGSLWFVSWLIIRLPEDYFVTEHERFRDAHPVIRVVIFLVSNLVGVILLAFGVTMLVAPGQGLITILLGLSLMSFPGKRKLLKWILQRKSIRHAMNWIRKKAHRPKLQFDDSSDTSSNSAATKETAK